MRHVSFVAYLDTRIPRYILCIPNAGALSPEKLENGGNAYLRTARKGNDVAVTKSKWEKCQLTMPPPLVETGDGGCGLQLKKKDDALNKSSAKRRTKPYSSPRVVLEYYSASRTYGISARSPRVFTLISPAGVVERRTPERCERANTLPYVWRHAGHRGRLPESAMCSGMHEVGRDLKT